MRIIIFFSALFLSCTQVAAAGNSDSYERCLLENLNTASGATTVAELKEICNRVSEKKSTAANKPTNGIVSQRLKQEALAQKNRFAILPHRSSYILPLSYNDTPNNIPFASANGESDLDNLELKFQFSFKTEILDNLTSDQTGLYFAYTNQSYWQHLDSENSGPFRETNHEPELFIQHNSHYNLGSWHIPLVRLGWIHQSNGQSDSLSRSWNRVFAEAALERGRWALSFKPWIVVNGATREDDTESIEDFMGNFELGVAYKGVKHTANVLLRNNLQSENRGAIQIDWTRTLPFSKRVRFLAQYFYGYGESLIDFDARSHRIGIGLQLSDHL